MRVIGFSHKKISIEKKKEPTGTLNLNTDIQVKEIQKRKTDLFKDQEVLAVDYEFKISYLPDFGEVLFEGNIVLLMEKEDEELVKKTLKEWKDKQIVDDLKLPLLNIIFSRCNLKALQLEEYVNLPFHIPNPKFSKKD